MNNMSLFCSEFFGHLSITSSSH